MAITRYAGDRFTVAPTDTKPTGVMPGAFLIDSGNQTSFVKTGYTVDPWVQIAGGGGGGSPGGSNTQVQFNDNGSFGGTTGLTFDGQRLYANNFQLSGILYDSNASVGEGGMVLANEGTTGVNWKSIESVLSGVGGSGVANYVARWSDEDTLTTGALVDNGTKVGIGMAPAFAGLELKTPAVGDSFYIKDRVSDDDIIRMSYGGATDEGLIDLLKNDAVKIRFRANAASYFNGGSVGIGTNNPGSKLQLGASLGTWSDNRIALQNSSVDSTITLGHDTNNRAWMYYDYSEGALAFSTRVSSTNYLDTLYLKNGKVGIGTTAPDYILHVNTAAGNTVGKFESQGANSQAIVRVENDARKWDLKVDGTASDKFKLRDSTAAADRLVVKSDGNVGIGTDDPLWKFQVDGTAFISGSVLIPNSSNYFGVYNAAGNGYIQAFYVDANDNLIVNKSNFQGNTIIKGDNIDLQPYDPLNVARSTLIVTGAGVGVPGSVGIGITNDVPQHTLHVSGDMQVSGYFYDSTSSTGVDGYVLTSKEDGPQWKMIEDVLSGVGGNGTAEYIPRWTDSDTIGDSVMAQSGSYIGIGTDAPGKTLDVNGDVRIRGDSGKLNFYRSTSPSDIAYIQYNNGTSRLDIAANNKAIVFMNENGPAESMRITSAGLVGIGTDAPNANLHVGSAAALGSQSNPALQIGGTTYYRLGFYTTAEGAVIENKNGDDGIIFKVKTFGEAMRIDSPNGSVGIGTTNPGVSLEVVGDATLTSTSATKLRIFASNNDPYISFGDNVNNWAVGVDKTDSSSFKISTTSAAPGTNDRITVLTDGNVGIGTDGPVHKFQVNGAAFISGSVLIPNNSNYFGAYNAAGNNYITALYVDSNDAVILNHGNYQGNTIIRGDAIDVQPFDSLNVPQSTLFVTGAGAGVPGSVGIGITSKLPQHTLHVSGDMQISGYLYDSTSSTGVDGYVLTSKEDGPQWKMIEDVLSGVGGNGTATYIPQWIDSDTIGDSVMAQSGNAIGIGTAAPTTLLEVNESTDNTAIIRIDSSETVDDTPASALDLFASSSTAAADKKHFRFTNLNDANSAGQNQLQFQSRDDDGSYGATLMVIEHDGGVGIGTNDISSGGKLQVYNGNVMLDQSAALNYYTIQLKGPAGSLFGGSRFFDAHSYNAAGNAEVARTWFTHSSEGIFSIAHSASGTPAIRLVIATDGKVGIGTTNPAYNLQVKGAGSQSISVSSTSTHAAVRIDRFNTSQDANLIFTTAGVNKWRLATGLAGDNEKLSIYDDIADANMMTFLSAVGVGIGTDTPGAKLEVAVDGLAYNAPAMILEMGTSGASQGVFEFQSNSVAKGRIRADEAGTMVISSMGSGDILFRQDDADGSTLVVMKNDGNVGIGTNDPQRLLHLEASTDQPRLKINSTIAGNGSRTGASIDLGLDGSTSNPNLAGDKLGILNFGGQGTDYTFVGAGIESNVIVGNSDRTAMSSDMRFLVMPAGQNGYREKMRITPDGEVGIGTTTTSSYKLKVEGITWLNDVTFIAGNNTAPPATSNSQDFGAIRMSNGTTVSMYQGATNTYGWVQVSRSTNHATNYPLVFQQNGGNVGIGTTLPTFAAAAGNTARGLHIDNVGNDTQASLRLTGHNNTGTPGAATYTELLHAGANLRFDINHNGTVRFSIASTGGITFNNAFTFPTADGTAGYHLQTDGAGAVTWQPGGAGTVTGTGTANYVSKWTGASSQGNSLIFDNGTNVGIGTAGPTRLLDLGTTYGTTVGSAAAKKFAIYQDGTNFYGLGVSAQTVGMLEFHAESTNTEAPGMALTRAGNVGIGNVAPAHTLHVQKDVDDYVAKIENDGNSTSSNGLWVDTRWNTATNTVFKVTSNSGTADFFYIKGDGNVGIGTTAPSQKLHVNGASLLGGSTTIAGNLVGAISSLFDLGTPSFKWRNLALSGTAIIDGALTGTTATFSGLMTAANGHFQNSSHTIVDIKAHTSGDKYSMLRMTSNGTQDNYIRADVGDLIIDGSHSSVNVTKALAVTGALTGTTATFSGHLITDQVKIKHNYSVQYFNKADDTSLGYLLMRDDGTNYLSTAGGQDFAIVETTSPSVRWMTFQASTMNVGIGTTNPFGYKLAVEGTTWLNDQVFIAGNDTAPPTSSNSQDFGAIRMSDGTLRSMYQGCTNTYGWIQVTKSTNHATNYPLALNPNGGDVGIGTPTPNTYGYTTATVLTISDPTDHANNRGILELESTKTTPADGDYLGAVAFISKNNAGSVRCSNIFSRASGSSGSGLGGKLYFATKADGGAEATRLTIGGDGTLDLVSAKFNINGSGGTNGYTIVTDGSGNISWSSAGTGTVTGTGTDNYVPRWNGTTALQNSAIYADDNGKVGIGTAAPASNTPLHIYTNSASDQKILLDNDGGGQSGLILRTDRNSEANISNFINFEANGNLGSTVIYSTIKSYIVDNSNSAGGTGRLTFTTAVDGTDTPALHITDGNVGIGTTAPATKLDVYGHLNLRDSYNLTWGGEYGANIPTIVAVSGGSAYLAIYPAGSTSGEKFRITNEGKVGIWSTAPGGYLSIEGTGNHRGIFVAATGATHYSAIQAEANALTTGSVGRFSSNSASTSTRYLVNIINDNAAATAAVGLRIQQDSTAPALIALGNVGIGSATPGKKLDVAGTFRVSNEVTLSDPNTAVDKIGDATTTGYRVRHSNLSQGIYIGYNTIMGAGSNANQDITIKSKGTGNLLLNSNDGGKVGIGTTNPGIFETWINAPAFFDNVIWTANAGGFGCYDTAGALKNILLLNSSDEVVINLNQGGAIPTRVLGDYITFEPADSVLNAPIETMRIVGGTGVGAKGCVGIGTDAPSAKLDIKQDANATSLRIDSAATTDQVIEIDAPLTTTAAVLDINDCNSLTTGKIAYFRSNSANTSARQLVEIVNDHASAAGTLPLKVIQDAANWGASIINTNAIGYGLTIDCLADTGTVVPALAVYTGTNTGMFVTNQGRVGIGIAAPVARLHVVQTGSDEAFRIDGASGGFAMVVKGGTTYNTMIRGGVTIGNTFAASAPPSNGLITEGSVGIGTTAPTRLLDVNGTSYFRDDIYFGNTVLNPASGFSNQTGMGWDKSTGQLQIASSSTALEVGRHSSVGLIFVCRYGSFVRATIDSSGDMSIAGTLTEASSLAIKENIETYSPSLEMISKIRPVRFNKKKSKKKEVGLVAEELAEMFPELVEMDEKGNPSGVNYSRAVAVLLHGFKELYKEVKELKEKI